MTAIHMPGNRVLVQLAAAMSLAAAVLCAQVGWNAPAGWALPAFAAFAVLAALAGRYSVRIIVGRQGVSFALADAVGAAALVLHPGAWVVAGTVAGFVLAYASRRLPALKLLYNAGQLALGMSCATYISHLLGGGVAPVLVGMLAFIAVNHMAISLAVALTSDRRFFESLRQAATLGILHNGGNLSIGLLAGWLLVNEPIALAGLAVPIALLWWSYRQQAERTAEARLFAELASSREQMTSTSVDTSAQLLVRSAARLFAGAEVELLLRHPDGLVRYSGNEASVDTRERAPVEALAAPWALRALGARGISSGSEDDRPYCSAVIGQRDRPTAVLIARRPLRAGPFTRQDERLAEVLVTQAEAWMSVAEMSARRDEAVIQARAFGDATRALGDLGAYTTPSLVALRESSDRLQRLANSFAGDDPIRDIVDELHAVERAVASLLGAVALASEGAPTSEFAALEGEMARNEAVRANRAARRAEWTTTGRLDPSDAA